MPSFSLVSQLSFNLCVALRIPETELSHSSGLPGSCLLMCLTSSR